MTDKNKKDKRGALIVDATTGTVHIGPRNTAVGRVGGRVGLAITSDAHGTYVNGHHVSTSRAADVVVRNGQVWLDGRRIDPASYQS